MSIPPKLAKTTFLSLEKVTDLSKWRGKSGLIYLVREAVEAVDWPHKQEGFSITPESAFPSVQLMTLEVYCYARGVYSSEEVEDIIRKDSVLKELFGSTWPDPRTILKYRRIHRDAILQCLRHVFERAFTIRFGEKQADSVPIDHCVALALDRWFEPICGPRPGSEAVERLDRAIFWDGMKAAETS